MDMGNSELQLVLLGGWQLECDEGAAPNTLPVPFLKDIPKFLSGETLEADTLKGKTGI